MSPGPSRGERTDRGCWVVQRCRMALSGAGPHQHSGHVDETFRIGRVSGIAIGVNWSVVVIFGLIVWNVAEVVLPEAAPGHGAVAYWSAGAAVSTAFFVCLLVHELSHAFVARRRGMSVEGITLWLFGGVSKLGGDAPDPATELRVAVAGPAASIALGTCLAAIALSVPAGELPIAAIAWLAGINVVLALFNLVPAFPLDGGRILRSVLWRQWGDRRAATATAASVGRAFGFGLVALGILFVATGPVVGGVWFVLIGWFIGTAGRSENDHVRTEALLGGRIVRDAMTFDPVTVAPDMTVDGLLHGMVLSGRHSAYPVVDRGRIVGLVTLDGIRSIAPERRPRVGVGEIAVPVDRVPLVSPTTPLSEAVDGMADATATRALVVDGGRLVGILTSADVQRMLRHAELVSG